MSLLSDALRAVVELRDLHRQAVTELRAIRRAVDSRRSMLTVAQAKRALQMGEDAADAVLKRLNVIRKIDGRDVVFLDELITARIRQVHASYAPSTPTHLTRRAPKPGRTRRSA